MAVVYLDWFRLFNYTVTQNAFLYMSVDDVIMRNSRLFKCLLCSLI